MDKCKAYLARIRGEYSAAVVFAETAGKAKALAMHTAACEDADFTAIEVYREKEADKYYQPGKVAAGLVQSGGSYCTGEGLQIYLHSGCSLPRGVRGLPGKRIL